MADFEYQLDTWRKAASGFEETSGEVSSSLKNIVGSTTSAEACGAANGYAPVDDAVGIMLMVFTEVMNSIVVPSVTGGLVNEATALDQTSAALQQMEDSAESIIRGIDQ